ncbi:MAG: GNAT family N-acetyltransferase [Acidimicrobiales bacterium]
MAYAGPVLLAGHHVLDGFECGKPALDEWLRRRAAANQAMGSTRTWVAVEDGTANVVAYYASSTASVLRPSAPTRIRRNQPEQIPAVLLARLAVSRHHAGQGLGAALLKHAVLKALEVADLVGVRVLLVHAKDEEAQSFYRHYGFVASPLDLLVLMMLLPDLS